jgi:hypothetical protein
MSQKERFRGVEKVVGRTVEEHGFQPCGSLISSALLYFGL